MKATEAKLLNFLKKSQQFVIPIYQRTYSWTEKECRQLWDDIVRCGMSDQTPFRETEEGKKFYGDDSYLLPKDLELINPE